jgi:uncharacterized protein YjhX (UPF0386 family)
MSRSEEGERWYYMIAQDGSLHLQRADGCWVIHAGYFGLDGWHVRAAHGVWVLFREGEPCVIEQP